MKEKNKALLAVASVAGMETQEATPKEISAAIYEKIMQPVIKKKIDPLRALAEITVLEKAITQAKKEIGEDFAYKTIEDLFKKRAENEDLPEKERTSKTLKLYGVEFQYKETGVRYDCSKYVDPETGEYVENAEYVAAAEKLKTMESHLKIDGKCIKKSGMSISVILK